MKLANFLTASRIFLSPLFFLAFFIPVWTGVGQTASVVILWVIFILIEISDFFDGRVARSRNEVSDLGKVMDPFADSFARLTYFVCFMGTGMMPIWIFIIILWRDLIISFFRLLNAKQGKIVAARMSGKIKAFIYAFACVAGLLVVTATRIPAFNDLLDVLNKVALGFFLFSAGTAIWTFIDYYRTILPAKE
ncbi:MAG: CDP-diacylglycerol--glycerol-3-phosphate 3-phosphatidyltransferase [Spirochaetales bacterium]|nr:CDP-diacylglycerol--glycerol-3-phosphate 3-phosphatidyltransferase [Spirochaetales bacterium]